MPCPSIVYVLHYFTVYRMINRMASTGRAMIRTNTLVSVARPHKSARMYPGCSRKRGWRRYNSVAPTVFKNIPEIYYSVLLRGRQLFALSTSRDLWAIMILRFCSSVARSLASKTRKRERRDCSHSDRGCRSRAMTPEAPSGLFIMRSRG